MILILEVLLQYKKAGWVYTDGVNLSIEELQEGIFHFVGIFVGIGFFRCSINLINTVLYRCNSIPPIATELAKTPGVTSALHVTLGCVTVVRIRSFSDRYNVIKSHLSRQSDDPKTSRVCF